MIELRRAATHPDSPYTAGMLVAGWPQIAIGVAGIALLGTVLWDAFQTMLVPRRIGRRIRLTNLFYTLSWRACRELARGIRVASRREGLLGHFAPLSVLLLLVFWASGLIVAFALIHYSVGTLANHGADRFAMVLYLSAETFFTLGYGDFTPATMTGRWLSAFEAGTGFAFLGTVIGYLPTMYSAFSQRETEITLMDGLAGSPPTAAEILLRLPETQRTEWLETRMRNWERWSAQLLESTISYPLIAYYRSQHSNQSWLGAVTAMLDTSSLVLAGADHLGKQQAQLTFAMARHALVDIAQIFALSPPSHSTGRLQPPEFQRLRDHLDRIGITIDNPGSFETRLTQLRREYEPYAQALAEHLLIDLPPFIHATARKDNWESAPWDRLMKAEPVVAVWDDEHF